MCQGWVIGLDSLYCCQWRKISKSRCELDLDQTMSNVKLVQATTICLSLSGLNHYFLSFYVNRKTHTHTHRQADRHTDRHEYSIVAVNKQQL